jgi:hypothetical protein
LFKSNKTPKASKQNPKTLGLLGLRENRQPIKSRKTSEVARAFAALHFEALMTSSLLILGGDSKEGNSAQSLAVPVIKAP